VVTVGQQLLYDAAHGLLGTRGRGNGRGGGRARPQPSAEPGAPVVARVRGADWDQVLELQRLQREDLLQSFLDKQRAVARSLGAEIPDSADAVDEVTGAGTGRAGSGRKGG
jgi:hypothetical protein